MNEIILGIETSCDDTSAAVVDGSGMMLSNVIASQEVHAEYGGVVPELASRAHQQNIVPVVETALRRAGVDKRSLTAIAFTRGPGLLGSLLVGTSFAKGLSLGLRVPLVDVNHLQAHALACFLRTPENPQAEVPQFPYLCLLVSGGNSQIILVRSATEMEILGRTIDDAAGEAFDKCAKVMGLPYPGGPVIDKLAKEGDPRAFKFAKGHAPGLDYSFSGLKTSFLYTLRDQMKLNPSFIEERRCDLAASLQHTIVTSLIEKLEQAVRMTGVKDVAIGGGVSANSAMRAAVEEIGRRLGVRTWLPERRFTTDNAAMVAVAGLFRYREGQLCAYDQPPYARTVI